MRIPDGSGFLGVMPGQISPDGERSGARGMKAESVFPGNARRGIDTHHGAHINALGFSIPTTRKIDTATTVAARLFVDRRESALHKAGDLLIPIREGAVNPDHIEAALGQVLIGEDQGRRSASDLTLVKSLGLAVEDVASAAFVAHRARATSGGQRVEL